MLKQALLLLVFFTAFYAITKPMVHSEDYCKFVLVTAIAFVIKRFIDIYTL